MTRNDFMEFFRDQESLNTLSPDDRVEVFQSILLGSSDFSAELLEDILADYSITHLMVVNYPPTLKRWEGLRVSTDVLPK